MLQVDRKTAQKQKLTKKNNWLVGKETHCQQQYAINSNVPLIEPKQ